MILCDVKIKSSKHKPIIYTSFHILCPNVAGLLKCLTTEKGTFIKEIKGRAI